MCVNHVTSGVQGKGGKIPRYQRSGIVVNSNGKHIDIKNADVNNLNKKQFEINLINPSFVPIGVYKCLTKMALTLMPEEELHTYSETFKWIKEEQHKGSRYVFDSLLSIYSYTTVPFPFISAILLKRKEHIKSDIPSIIFRLTYGNFSFQTYIPLCSLDNKNSYQTEQLLYIPHLIDITKGLITSEKNYVDFNVDYKVKSDMTKVQIKNLDNQ